MAKRESTPAPPVAPAPDPIDHPAPAARAHLWARPARPDEIAAPADPIDYPHTLPRYVHKDGATLYVKTPQACEDARADGWLVDPNDPAA